MPQRSTTLKLASRHCPHVLDFYDAGAPYDRAPFAAGVAAHAVLQVLGETAAAGGMDSDADVTAIADAVVRELVTTGRSFDGTPEPAMRVEAAVEGRDLALAWVRDHELARTGAVYEYGAAVNTRWEPVHYDAPDAYYRAVFDVLDVYADADEDGYPVKVVTVRDYKSAWPTDASELDTVQMRGQAVLAAAIHPDATVIRQEVVNLRTRMVFDRDVVLDDAGRDLLATWRRDIDLLIAQAEKRGPDGTRPAAPGAGCMGCPYLIRCDAARAYMRGSMLDGVDAAGIAVRFAVADAFRADLFERAKAATEEAPIAVPGGVVGFVEKEERKPSEDVARVIAHAWFKVDPDKAATWDGVNGHVIGLLAALRPGATAIENLAKVLVPSVKGDRSWKERREALVNACLNVIRAPKFGVHRNANAPEVTTP